jgi:acyl-CoA hydrolase
MQEQIFIYARNCHGQKWLLYFGIANTFVKTIIKHAKTVVVEVNKNIPYCLGGLDESVHISEVDYIVESDHAPLLTAPEETPSETEKKIASMLINEMKDGSCIQLGIGGMPNALGKLIASSGLKDLGVHTEMLVDSYIDMFEQGCNKQQQEKSLSWKNGIHLCLWLPEAL